MYSTAPYAVRFREARERARLTPDDAASLMGISSPWLWDIECYDDELPNCSPGQIRRFCQMLGIAPRELFGIDLDAPPITASELAARIRERCRAGNISVDQFEDACGWLVAKSLDDPERFLHDDYSIEGIQDICREANVDWRRFMLSW